MKRGHGCSVSEVVVNGCLIWRESSRISEKIKEEVESEILRLLM